MDKAYVNAVASNQCPSNNGWAGHAEADPVLKSAILAAKASGIQVTVTIDGCLGRWFKIKRRKKGKKGTEAMPVS
jgi:hypothetical protein